MSPLRGFITVERQRRSTKRSHLRRCKKLGGTRLIGWVLFENYFWRRNAVWAKLAGNALLSMAGSFQQFVICLGPAGRRPAGAHRAQTGAIAGLQAVDRLPAAQTLKLAIGLPLRNREALTNLLRNLYYHVQPLLPSIFETGSIRANFGPSEKDYQSLIQFAKASGFSIVGAPRIGCCWMSAARLRMWKRPSMSTCWFTRIRPRAGILRADSRAGP